MLLNHHLNLARSTWLFVNMKGGVGKTTLATQLAWHAVLEQDKKVLLIDLDPQANASQSVMSPQSYVDYLDANGATVADIFEQFTPTGTASGSPKQLDPSSVIYNRVAYGDGSLLDLVPSRLELSWTLRNPTGKETLLARFVAKIEMNYDLIVIDCSPTDSILTDAAYHCSRYLLVPIRAEFLASIGFPLLNRSIRSFEVRHDDKVLEVAGLVFNDFVRGNEKREHQLSRSDVQAKAIQYGWYVFENDIPHSDSYFRAARDGMPIGSTKGTHTIVKREFSAFAREFWKRIAL
ncbi:ParA family protein [Longimicrobium terrae]|uniref:Chromosome partitioning protein n=1 Tax=Longimicrobium terrae TaxID=1639882 RepID=A0A841GYG7_9BACT|nr:chromosome partitioning protein [Longimicrobium terrae]MBB6070759.1 chromosome partitioning protein [Longimicrobium terrae]